MKRIRLISVFLFVVVVSYGQARTSTRRESDGDVRERDRIERTVNRHTYISKDIFGNTVIKDDHDRTIKSIEKDIFGNTIIKDGNGHKIRSFEKDIFGNTQIKDGNGRTIQSIEKDIFDNTIVKDGDRKTILTIGQDIFGTFIVKDADGNVLLSFIKDAGGNRLIIRDNPGREMIDDIEMVLFLNFDGKSSDVLKIEQSPYYLY